ncbi:hypothetical protein [Agromyces indicus]|uniref:Uncharacterized protein n=1 Tax=Agromyces indicus TaxID=758919 RepID=A0ABU1FK45_9MICO|nr:hypothetical protein [Agromyces indicus]MDR5692132.1 hypothetical protein [Agromyces indicus]
MPHIVTISRVMLMFSAPDDAADHPARSDAFAEFESDLTAEDWIAKYRAGDLVRGPLHWSTLEVISPTRTIGRGRTNLTLIRPTILQTDAAEPFAGFDLRESPNRNPAVSVHFRPSAYGATGVATYVFTFAVDAPTRAHFTPGGYAGSGTVDAAGSIRFSGRRAITVILRDVPPGLDASASIEQTDGASWSWFSTRISLPPIVIGPIADG